ncbi:hypothetical protein SAMN04487980_103766 [Streptomyces sp. cf124]|uniref:hypothetical protein n=1 Tax=Streptomyces sp. cf124 TaxID=1761903 RepID=UPI0008F15A59|nr:hypothetical protein SAMN04487980_103766 [Streptomyces sp. cf124]
MCSTRCVLDQCERAVTLLLDAGFGLPDAMPVLAALENVVLGSALDLAAFEPALDGLLAPARHRLATRAKVERAGAGPGRRTGKLPCVDSYTSAIIREWRRVSNRWSSGTRIVCPSRRVPLVTARPPRGSSTPR